MTDSLDIALIGAGNLAWHLGPALENKGHKISIVKGRGRKKTSQLVEKLYNARQKNNLDFSAEPVKVIILAVPDSAIQEIVPEIILPDQCLLLHTSGCQPIDLLEKSASPLLGVLYPLQTFTRKSRIDFRNIPLYLEANNELAEKRLTQLAKSLSNCVYFINSVQRSILHLSAVFASNFSNHMITIAHELMREHHLDHRHLEPVIQSMVDKAFSIGPSTGQTGPARRGDYVTLDKHMELLEGNEELMEIYAIISKHIKKSYQS